MKTDRIITILTLILLTSCASIKSKESEPSGGWTLDMNNSQIQLITTKNNSISEISHFKNFHGGVDENLNFKLVLDMNSLETNIPIRNERMQKVLFETHMFPTAEAHTTLKPEHLSPGIHDIEFDVDAHGVSSKFHAQVRVFKEDGHMIVTLDRPVVFQAGYFGLTHGVEQLRKIAGLDSIDSTVPLSFRLNFTKD